MTATQRKPKPQTNGERDWQANADEFAQLSKGEGWAFAIRVACSVEPNARNGRPKNNPLAREGFKTSASEFARSAHTTATRVKRYLDQWDQAHANGYVLDRMSLSPADVVDFVEPDIPWHKQEGGAYHYPESEPPPVERKPATVKRETTTAKQAADKLIAKSKGEVSNAIQLPTKPSLAPKVSKSKTAVTKDLPGITVDKQITTTPSLPRVAPRGWVIDKTNAWISSGAELLDSGLTKGEAEDLLNRLTAMANALRESIAEWTFE